MRSRSQQHRAWDLENLLGFNDGNPKRTERSAAFQSRTIELNPTLKIDQKIVHAAETIPLFSRSALSLAQDSVTVSRPGVGQWTAAMHYFKSGGHVFDVEVESAISLKTCVRVCLIAAFARCDSVYVAHVDVASQRLAFVEVPVSVELRTAVLTMLQTISDPNAVNTEARTLRSWRHKRWSPSHILPLPIGTLEWSEMDKVKASIADILTDAAELLRVSPTEMIVLMVGDTARETTSEVGLMMSAKGKGGQAVRRALEIVADEVLQRAGSSRDHLRGDPTAAGEVSWPRDCTLPAEIATGASPPVVKVHPLAHTAVDGEHHRLLSRGGEEEEVPTLMTEMIRSVRMEVKAALLDSPKTVHAIEAAALAMGGESWKAAISQAARDATVTSNKKAGMYKAALDRFHELLFTMRCEDREWICQGVHMSFATNFYVPHPRDDRISWTSIDAGHLIKRLRSAATGGSATTRQITPMISRPVLDQAASNDPTLRGILNGADPQSVQYAIYLFSEVVERRMADAGAKEEAELVALIREFWEAHDRRGLSAEERRRRLLALRTWLLSQVDMNDWLKNGVPGYVRGIPINTFEALIASAEAVVALQSFSRTPNSVNAICKKN